MRSDKFIREVKEVWNYLKEFANWPHKLSKELLLFLIQGYGTDKSDYTTRFSVLQSFLIVDIINIISSYLPDG